MMNYPTPGIEPWFQYWMLIIPPKNTKESISNAFVYKVNPPIQSTSMTYIPIISKTENNNKHRQSNRFSPKKIRIYFIFYSKINFMNQFLFFVKY